MTFEQIWRCWIVWGRKWWVVIVPLLGTVAGVGEYRIENRRLSLKYAFPKLQPWPSCRFTVSFNPTSPTILRKLANKPIDSSLLALHISLHPLQPVSSRHSSSVYAFSWFSGPQQTFRKMEEKDIEVHIDMSSRYWSSQPLCIRLLC
jgi:hypothetical protein